MPPLRPPTAASRIELPPRTATLAAATDVLIVGGGPSGLGAAIGAAAAGARVILAERYGFLGGNATAALVMPLTSFHAHRDRTPKLDETALFPTDQGPGEPIVSGAFRRLLGRFPHVTGPCFFSDRRSRWFGCCGGGRQHAARVLQRMAVRCGATRWEGTAVRN